jgi:hypothetical protein
MNITVVIGTRRAVADFLGLGFGGVYLLLNIIMLSVNFFCNISSYDILAYITKNYIAHDISV